jgi:ribosomal-protein-alanine N-acetyltransferase
VRDAAAFVAAVGACRRLHRAWVAAPDTPPAFRRYLARFGGSIAGSAHVGYLAVRRDDDALAGVFNFSEIVRGAFESAYLGYYALAPHAGRGYMTEALALALDRAFGELALHRVEVNIQPRNRRSLDLVERAGFEREGYSRRYVRIAGRWRDHVRFAMLAEDWPRRRRALLASLAERPR